MIKSTIVTTDHKVKVSKAELADLLCVPQDSNIYIVRPANSSDRDTSSDRKVSLDVDVNLWVTWTETECSGKS